MKNSHHGPDEYLSTISLTINKNPSQLGAKASEGGPFPSTSSCLSGPARIAARCCRCSGPPPELRRRASLWPSRAEGEMWQGEHGNMLGKCWKMMINYGCGQGFEGECVFFRRGHMGRRAYFFKDSWFCSWWLIVFGGGDGRWMSMGRCLFLLHQLCFFALSNIEIVSKNIRQCTEIYQALRWKCLKHGSWSWSNYRGLDNCKDLVWLVVWNSFYFSIYWE